MQTETQKIAHAPYIDSQKNKTQLVYYHSGYNSKCREGSRLALETLSDLSAGSVADKTELEC